MSPWHLYNKPLYWNVPRKIWDVNHTCSFHRLSGFHRYTIVRNDREFSLHLSYDLPKAKQQTVDAESGPGDDGVHKQAHHWCHSRHDHHHHHHDKHHQHHQSGPWCDVLHAVTPVSPGETVPL
ncbi:Hypothetical predicted protein [Octopus vulgaris]|uniref:Uncharacterized protein n=1 Tax=Octopus vulgaris TaxID=6645 RepID=A0AA36FBW0_OCTVU|nr:Hypothetical predicted protein [Octopus vulgaris]